VSSTSTTYISSLVCPNIADYLLLLTAAFDIKKLTDDKTRVHVIEWLFCPQNTQFGVLGPAQFGSRTPIVSSKLRYKRDSSFILEDQCTYP